MSTSLKSRWFPTLAEEEARLHQEQLDLSRKNSQMIRWVNDEQFSALIAFVEGQIIRNEPDENTVNPLFKNGVVKGLRIVEANLKTLRGKVQEMSDV